MCTHNARIHCRIYRSSELQNLSTKESFQDNAIVADSSLNVDELKTVPKWKRWTSILVLCFTMVDIMSSTYTHCHGCGSACVTLPNFLQLILL